MGHRARHSSYNISHNAAAQKSHAQESGKLVKCEPGDQANDGKVILRTNLTAIAEWYYQLYSLGTAAFWSSARSTPARQTDYDNGEDRYFSKPKGAKGLQEQDGRMVLYVLWQVWWFLIQLDLGVMQIGTFAGNIH